MNNLYGPHNVGSQTLICAFTASLWAAFEHVYVNLFSSHEFIFIAYSQVLCFYITILFYIVLYTKLRSNPILLDCWCNI